MYPTENGSPSSSPAKQGGGIYIHVPFCASRCLYCDFYSTTFGAAVRHSYVRALCHEMRCRAHEVGKAAIHTIYIGGGTPSTLTANELTLIFETLRQTFLVSETAEVTLEVNPDDVSPAFCALLKTLGVNRVSLGVQTFDDDLLRFLHRRHTGQQAERAIKQLAASGIQNFSADLIFGLPHQSLPDWKDTLAHLLSLPVTHLSAYALMYEEGTMLTRMKDCGEIAEADEETSRAMYETLIAMATAAGFDHYEISNFAKPSYRSRHNSSYWTGLPYWGFGAGAHSYDGQTLRRANRPDVQTYIEAAKQHVDTPHDLEPLTDGQRCDERIFTALRTSRGLAVNNIRRDFGEVCYQALVRAAMPHLKAGLLQLLPDGRLRLTHRGLFVSDGIMADLMIGEDGAEVLS